MSSTVDPLIGSTLAGRYRIVERIGAGAMGAVYRAEQLGLSRPVALKVLRQDAAWDPTTVARFQREARAMSALTHPNTVRVFDFGKTDDGMLFLAMELLHGELASDRLRRGRVPPREALCWVLELLDSIGEAHDKKIIHRDLKPDNLFLAQSEDAPPSVRVLDFGIAKAVEGERAIDQFETLDGSVFGTPRYMSPEQAAGKPLDHRSDLYAVGIILYELLTGSPPFVDADAVVVMAQHIREPAPPLHRAAPDVPWPAALQRVLDRALHKSPDMRFQNARELAAALRACAPELEALDRGGVLGRGALRAWPASAKLGLLGGASAGLLTLAFLLVLGGDEAAREEVGAAAAQARAGGGEHAPAGADDGERKIVTLETSPAGAEVYRDGERLGVTPLSVPVHEGRSVRLELRKHGFIASTVDLTTAQHTRVVSLSADPVRSGGQTGRARRAEPVRKAAARKAATREQPEPASGSPYEKFR